MTERSRVRIKKLNNGITFYIPSRSRPTFGLHLLYKVPLIILGLFILIIYMQADYAHQPIDDGSIVMLILILLFVPLWIYSILWPGFGYERITLDRSLKYEWGYLRIPIVRFVFNLDIISSVRLATQANNDVWRIAIWGKQPSFFRRQRLGLLVLDAGAEPFAFGNSLSPVEAKMLADTLNAQLKDDH